MIRNTALSGLVLSGLLGGAALAQSPSGAVDGSAGRLAAALRIDTVVRDEAGFPAVGQVAAFRAFLQTAYPDVHHVMRREITDHHGTLFTWAGRDPDQPPILLIAHMDVVPAGETGDAVWRHPPFGGVIADGAIWGRGAIDMKGQLVAIFEALEILADEGFVPERTIMVGVSADEEAGGQGARAISDLLAKRGVVAEFVLDEGPVVVDPFPLTGQPAAFIGVAEKGYGSLRVTATDDGGHSAVPGEAPALESLARAILLIGDLPVERGLDRQARATLAALSPDLRGLERLAVDNLWLFGPLIRRRLLEEPAGRALLGTTFAPTMAEGATKENQLPSVATAQINVRLHPRDPPETILAMARAAITDLDGVSVEWASTPWAASAYSATDSAAYRLLARHAGRLADTPVAPILVFGVTDARLYAPVAANAYRFQPYVLTQQELESIHGPDEHLSLENLGRAITFFRGLIRDASSASGASGIH